MSSDPSDVRAALERGTVDEVVQMLDPGEAASWTDGHRPALALALQNRSPADRLAIAHLLLDRGADAGFVLGRDRVGALHILFSHEPHDFAAEGVLATRLMDCGADPNLVSARFGSPLATLAAAFKYTDQTLQPFYTALIDSGRLDLDTVDKGGRTMLENIAVKVTRRQSLYDQLRALPPNTSRGPR
ncbi:hypothetical protein [Microbacterium sp. gxy059]|uniref:hypothetical protein n=1 Tax=Microbacterium sp. gxy059 TaxID=2957199 RepID=UPI003D9724B8